MSTKKIMTLHLSDDQMTALEELSSRECSSKADILRRALRFYLAVDSRIQKGEKIYFVDSAHELKSEMMLF